MLHVSGFLCCCFRPLKRSKSIRRHRWSSAFEDGPIVFVPALAGRNETIVFRFRVRFSVSGIFRCHNHAQTCGGGGAHVPRGGCDEGSNEVFASLAYRWQTVNKHIVMDACLIIPTPYECSVQNYIITVCRTTVFSLRGAATVYKHKHTLTVSLASAFSMCALHHLFAFHSSSVQLISYPIRTFRFRSCCKLMSELVDKADRVHDSR